MCSTSLIYSIIQRIAALNLALKTNRARDRKRFDEFLVLWSDIGQVG
jgi:hypothetical protein